MKLKSRQLKLVLLLIDLIKNEEIELFARVKVPSNLPRFVVTTAGDDRRYIPLEQVITANISELFPGMEVLNVYTFRITRNADLELEEEESEDLLASMEQELLRRKFGPPVRLEIGLGMDADLLETLKEELSVKDDDSTELQGILDQGYRGSRYSFGYPACPDLEQQVQLCSLLEPERIGVELSEEFQLHPEQSTSAIIVHHPEAKYFNAN